MGARAVRLGAEHHPEVTLLSDLNSVIDYTGGSLTDRVILGCHQDSNYIYIYTHFHSKSSPENIPEGFLKGENGNLKDSPF